MNPPITELALNGFVDGPFTSIHKAHSNADIKATLHQLVSRDSEVTARLNALIATHSTLERELGRLDILRANVGSQTVSARSISHGVLANAAFTAARISEAVKWLDLEQARVRSTLNVVEQVAELKACVLGVTGSMGGPQDWETAASYLNRASKIPNEIVNGAFAEKIVPTAEVPDPPKVTLEQAAESLRGLFLREFEKAAQEGNGTRVTRFFKLFPLIGKPDVGLDIYGRYVCQGVASRARANLHAGTEGTHRKESLFYANALTKLFEHVAQIVEHHGTLVERHYGPGRMNKVIERLQVEADIQGGIILDTWSDERDIDGRLTNIKAYAFTFLVQSFLPVQPTRSATPRAGSPASRVSIADGHGQEDENVNMKDIDGHLGEIALMLGRWSLYSRFISSKCKDITEISDDEFISLKAPLVLLDSALSRKVSDRLVTPFNIMITFFFRRSVEKAFQLDEQPAGLTLNPARALGSSPPFITSAVDDILYIVNQVIERSLATSQRAVVLSVVPMVARVLGSDFIGMIQRKMRDESYPKAAMQNAIPPEHIITQFFVLLNNLDVATDYVKRIIGPRIEAYIPKDPHATNTTAPAGSIVSLFPFERDSELVQSALKSLQQSFDTKASELINDGVFVVFKNIVKPRLRPILADTFRDIDYQVNTEEQGLQKREGDTDTGDESNSGFGLEDQFQKAWDALTKPIARILTERNFDKLLTATITYLAEVLEKRIWSYYGRLNNIGSARLERDIASIVTIVVRGGRYSLREAFSRCIQICLVMNMEDEEWDELKSIFDAGHSRSEFDWKLNSEERLRARAMIQPSQS